ncbi:GumC family protein [Novosphingobium bradum]
MAIVAADEPLLPALVSTGFDLRHLLATVRANLVLIAGIVAMAVAFAVVATLLQTPRYTATATLQINDASGRVFKDEGSDPSAEMPGWDIDRNLKTQVDILKSRALAQRVVQKLKLADNPQFFLSQEVPVPERGRPAAAVNALAIGLLQQGLAVTPPRDSRIVSIAWESTDPRMSALIASTYASEFIQANLQRKFESSAYARNFIGEQLAETKKRLAASERAVNDYARGNGLIQLRNSGGGDGKGSEGGASLVTTSSLLQINQAANEATSRRISAESRLRAISDKALLSTPEVLNNGTVAALLQQRSTARAELQQERARHLDGYPTVVAKAAQVAALDRQISEAAMAVKQSILADYQAAQSAEERLTAQVNTLKSDTLGEQDRTVQYSLLAREADTNRQLYDGLLQRYKELNASAGISLSNIAIIDTAEVPNSPSSPNLFRNLLIAIAVGSVLAAGTVFLKTQFDDSIRAPDDVESKCDLPLLGVVPRAVDKDPAAAMEDPKSPISEAYNSLRGSLLYSTSEGLPQVVLVTSAQPAEGKTTTSLAVAASFARMGKSVLLIDADLRRPTLHRQVGSRNERGLSSLLTSKDPLDSAIVPSGQANLMLLTSGAIPPSPTELVSGVRLEQVVQEAAQRFDLVIIDSPPVLGLADAPIMAPLVDGVIFVIEAGRSRRGSLKAALRRLRAMRPIILGAVLTKFDPAKSGNGYSEYYGYEYFQYGTAAAKD